MVEYFKLLVTINITPSVKLTQLSQIFFMRHGTVIVLNLLRPSCLLYKCWFYLIMQYPSSDI